MVRNNDAPETILTEVAAILKRHTETLLYHKQAFEQIFEEMGKINQRLDKLESADSIDSDDAKFLMGVASRLEAISTALPKQDAK